MGRTATPNQRGTAAVMRADARPGISPHEGGAHARAEPPTAGEHHRPHSRTTSKSSQAAPNRTRTRRPGRVGDCHPVRLEDDREPERWEARHWGVMASSGIGSESLMAEGRAR
jgi:hypothetical protein